MDGETFARVEADDETPLLPSDVMTLQDKAGAFGLGNMQGFDIEAERGDTIGGIVARLGRQRPLTVFFNTNYLHRVEVNDGANAFDRAGIAVVGRVGTEEAERPDETLGAFFFLSRNSPRSRYRP